MAFAAPTRPQDYPPAAFQAKYGLRLAPRGRLLAPKEAFAPLGAGAEDAIRKAFKVTFKRLAKMKAACSNCSSEDVSITCGGCGVARYCGAACRDARAGRHAAVCGHLRAERVDQVVECLPGPLSLGPEVLRGPGGLVAGWGHWLAGHTSLQGALGGATALLRQWWPLVPIEYPGDEAVSESLKRMVSNVFSTVLTVAHCLPWVLQARAMAAGGASNTISLQCDSNGHATDVLSSLAAQSCNLLPGVKEMPAVHIHLIGADKPEVDMVQSGLAQLIARTLGRPAHLTLVAPDLAHHPATAHLSPRNPTKIGRDISVGCYPGLYHKFWDEYVEPDNKTQAVPRPAVAVAVHPGLHAADMWRLWRPTLALLRRCRVPLLLSTYNRAEYEASLQVLRQEYPPPCLHGPNPLASLALKQTPREPDYVWAANSFLIVLANNSGPE